MEVEDTGVECSVLTTPGKCQSSFGHTPPTIPNISIELVKGLTRHGL